MMLARHGRKKVMHQMVAKATRKRAGDGNETRQPGWKKDGARYQRLLL
jgi:hypothetical protein